jgi:hypothetical protein
MSRLHKNTPAGFSWLPNEIINNPNLSWKAKGILLYLNSKPEGWKFNYRDIQRRAKDGMAALRSGVKELQDHEFLTITPERDDKGEIEEWTWTLQWPDPDSRYPDSGNPNLDKPHYSKSIDSKTVNTLGDGDEVRDLFGGNANGNGRPPQPPTEKLHDIFCDIYDQAVLVGISGPRPNLTATRKQKYSSLWDEQLKDHDDPFALFRQICINVTHDEFLSQNTNWLYPESFLKNAERRERWTVAAITTPRSLGSYRVTC